MREDLEDESLLSCRAATGSQMIGFLVHRMKWLHVDGHLIVKNGWGAEVKLWRDSRVLGWCVFGFFFSHNIYNVNLWREIKLQNWWKGCWKAALKKHTDFLRHWQGQNPWKHWAICGHLLFFIMWPSFCFIQSSPNLSACSSFHWDNLQYSLLAVTEERKDNRQRQ